MCVLQPGLQITASSIHGGRDRDELVERSQLQIKVLRYWRRLRSEEDEQRSSDRQYVRSGLHLLNLV
jgi:hypothetical protein